MGGRFQFSMRNALLATALVAGWCAMATIGSLDPRGDAWEIPAQLLWVFLIITLPAATVGALFGHPAFGFLCGSAGAAAFIAWIVWMGGL